MDSPRTKIKSTADSTAGAIFGMSVVACVCAALIMLTVKLGMVLFG